MTASAMLWPNSVIILPLTEHWVKTNAIDGAAEGPNIQVGAQKGCISDFMSHMYCVYIFLYGSIHSVSSGITTGRAPTFIFEFCQGTS